MIDVRVIQSFYCHDLGNVLSPHLKRIIHTWFDTEDEFLIQRDRSPVVVVVYLVIKLHTM